MRTTITLDDDVVAKIKAEMQKTGASFKDVVNRRIRSGFLEPKQPNEVRPVLFNARPLGLRPGLNYNSTSELLDQIEGPFHR